MEEEETRNVLKKNTAGAGSGHPPGITRIGAGEDGSGDNRKKKYAFWTNYKKLVKESWNKMSPSEQRELVFKARLISLVLTGLVILSLLRFWFG